MQVAGRPGGSADPAWAGRRIRRAPVRAALRHRRARGALESTDFVPCCPAIRQWAKHRRRRFDRTKDSTTGSLIIPTRGDLSIGLVRSMHVAGSITAHAQLPFAKVRERRV